MRPSISGSRRKCSLTGCVISVIWCIVLIGGLIQGCGKKADPFPLRISMPRVISDLRAERKEEGIVLSWTAKISEGSFRILRNEQFPDEEVCADCPRNYTVVSDLTTDDPHLIRKGSDHSYSWIDASVKKENSYSYQVVVCNASGVCGGASNIVDVSK